MSNRSKVTPLVVALAVGVAAGSAAYAQETNQPAPDQGAAPQGGTMTPDMMPGGNAMQGGDMMGMMNMMTQMTQMMETCNKMMQSAMQAPVQQPQQPGEPQKQGG